MPLVGIAKKKGCGEEPCREEYAARVHNRGGRSRGEE
jgi:hypothetical protein